jgi:large subunit ribosomal protein L24
MSAAKIRKGDRVVILAGKDKGRDGEVLRVSPKDGTVLVSGVNMIARHTKPTQADPEGGIRRREAPLHVSNVAIKDPKTGRPARVGFEVRDGRKVRVLKGSGEVLNG